METYYNVFTRNWRMENGMMRVLGAEPKTYLRKHVTFTDARAICEEYNSTQKVFHSVSRKMIRKAEFEQA